MPKNPILFLLFLLFSFTSCTEKKTDFFTSGFKALEVTDSSVLIWTRLYGQERPNPITHERRPEVFRHPIEFNEDMPVEQLDGGVKGIEGEVKITISDGTDEQESPWLAAVATNDFTVNHHFNSLSPGTTYTVHLESKSGNTIEGSFTTAPSPTTVAPMKFTISTCQYFWSFDDSLRGFKTYEAMNRMDPDFFIQTGDYVYYDKPGPSSKNLATARHKWHAMDSWPSLVDFHLQTPMYMIKDDHDLLKDDISEPTESYGNLTYAQGLKIWKENVPLKGNPYRTIRWGKDLQVWLLEGREFRSVNKMEDGPEKTILGETQKDWLVRTLKESEASFKVLISATPIVGPDRDKKNDNHANEGFKSEGDWVRTLLASVEDVYIVNGDRHWQYHSVDAATGIHEFDSGPISNFHAQGWSPDDKRPEHQFLRVNGGYLGVEVLRDEEQPQITFTHYDVDGNEVYSKSFETE